jgi:hypothetical protein
MTGIADANVCSLVRPSRSDDLSSFHNCSDGVASLKSWLPCKKTPGRGQIAEIHEADHDLHAFTPPLPACCDAVTRRDRIDRERPRERTRSDHRGLDRQAIRWRAGGERRQAFDPSTSKVNPSNPRTVPIAVSLCKI